MAAKKYAETNQRILASLDLLAEFRAMGVQISGSHPNANGYIGCHAVGREDRTPSACVNVTGDGAKLGRYKDSGANEGAGSSLSFWDFCVQFGGYADYKSAREHFARKAGVDLTSGGRPPKNPNDLVEWIDWNEQLAQIWLVSKPGISPEALKMAGCRMGRYPKKTRKFTVLAAPVYGTELLDADPVSYVIWNVSGGNLPVKEKDGSTGWVKMKTLEGTSGGLMNPHSLKQLTPGFPGKVWKVEGPTDMMAMITAILAHPDEEVRAKHLVTTNSGGSRQNVENDFANLFVGCDVGVVHDADIPGDLGASKWVAALNGIAKQAGQTRLPYTIEPKRGLDLRHYFSSGDGTFADLLILAQSQLQAREQKKTEDAARRVEGLPPVSDEPSAEIASEHLVVQHLKLDVLGEMENGSVKVFSDHHRKGAIIQDVARLTYQKLLQIGGPPIKERVNPGNEPSRDMIHMSVVRDSIAMLAGYRRIGEQTEIGQGCWQGMHTDGTPYDSVVAVGAGEAAELNGTGSLTKLSHPRCKGHLMNLSSSDHWFDFDRLKSNIDTCDAPWAIAAMNDAINIYSKWRWRQRAAAPIVLAGLTLASWVQSLWEWRPQVAITGPSKAGKSTLFKCQSAVFGKLALNSSQSSAAGIRQAISTSSKIVLCDEFEDGKERYEILKMLRTSGGGTKILRGQTNQRGLEFGLRHIVWVAAIEVGLKREPDRNRFITMELARPRDDDKGKLQLPSAAQLGDLGQRLLAVAMKYIHAARPLAVRLKENRIPGIDDRILESYSVPAAMLASLRGLNDEQAMLLMREMLAGTETDEANKSGDETDLLHAILGRQIHMSRGTTLNIAQLIDIVIRRATGCEECEQALARSGIKFDTFSEKDHPGLAGQWCLVLAYELISEHLLKKTEWENQSIEQILRRLPFSIQGRRRVGGKRCRCLLLVKEYLEEEFLGTTDEETSVGSGF